MKPKTLVPLVIGLGVGFFAIKMAVDMVQRAKGSQVSTEMRDVLVAAKPVEVAMMITEEAVTTKKVPANLVPKDAFSDKVKLVGRVSAMTLAAGMPITEEMLAPPGSEPGLRSRIPAGCRAVSVRVNEETAVSGFVMPGSRVDVSSVSRGGAESTMILEDVEVGAVGQTLSRVGPDGKKVNSSKTVTLFLSPEQVQSLYSHSGQGRIQLSLRSNTEPELSLWGRLARDFVDSLSAAPDSASREVSRQPAQPGDAQQHVVEVIRGSDVEHIVFDEYGRLVSHSDAYSGHTGGATAPNLPDAADSPADAVENKLISAME